MSSVTSLLSVSIDSHNKCRCSYPWHCISLDQKDDVYLRLCFEYNMRKKNQWRQQNEKDKHVVLEHMHHFTIWKYFHLNVLPEVYWKLFFLSTLTCSTAVWLLATQLQWVLDLGPVTLVGGRAELSLLGGAVPHRQRCTFNPQVGCRCAMLIIRLFLLQDPQQKIM